MTVMSIIAGIYVSIVTIFSAVLIGMLMDEDYRRETLKYWEDILK